MERFLELPKQNLALAEKLGEGGCYFEVEGVLEGSSTSDIFVGTLFDEDGERVHVTSPWSGLMAVRMVVKLPDIEDPGLEPLGYYQNPEGVTKLLRLELAEVGMFQVESPYVGVFGAEWVGDNKIQILGHDEGEVGVDCDPSLVLYEVPEQYWLPNIIQSALGRRDWSTILDVTEAAIGAALVFRKPADKEVALQNTPDIIRFWPDTNFFENMDALREGEDELVNFLTDHDERVDDTVIERLRERIGGVQHRQANLMRSAYEEFFREGIGEVMSDRVEEEMIVNGHGDFKGSNLFVVPSDNNEIKIEAVDGSRFMDIESGEVRSWHIRDRMWDPAYFIATTAVEVASVSGLDQARQYLSDVFEMFPEYFSEDDMKVFGLYFLYALYVHADTYFRAVHRDINPEGDNLMAAEVHLQIALDSLALGEVFAKGV